MEACQYISSLIISSPDDSLSNNQSIFWICKSAHICVFAKVKDKWIFVIKDDKNLINKKRMFLRSKEGKNAYSRFCNFTIS